MADSLTDRIARLGRGTLDTVASLGRAAGFLWGALVGVPRPSVGLPLIVRQIYHVGVLSLAIVLVSGLFIGMVLALQGYYILSDFGSESAIGQMIALTLLRELGPVVTALLFAGRAGSALTAEIGLMKATEQLSSMEMCLRSFSRWSASGAVCWWGFSGWECSRAPIGATCSPRWPSSTMLSMV